MENKHTSVFVDLEIKKTNGRGTTITTHSATLDHLGYLGNVISFLDDLKKIGKLLRKAVKDDAHINIYFGRYTAYEENGVTYMCDERGARYDGSGIDVCDNGGMYLRDENGNTGEDFWLDGNADLLEALRDFADDPCYWSDGKREIF